MAEHAATGAGVVRAPVERFLPSPGIHCANQQWGSDLPRHYWDASGVASSNFSIAME